MGSELTRGLIHMVLSGKLDLDECQVCGEPDRLLPFVAEGELLLVPMCEGSAIAGYGVSDLPVFPDDAPEPSLGSSPLLDAPDELLRIRQALATQGASAYLPPDAPEGSWEEPENLYEDLKEARKEIWGEYDQVGGWLL